MSSSLHSSLIASDVFEEIVKRSEYGKSIEDRIIHDELGNTVYVTNITLMSVLQKSGYNHDNVKNSVGLLHFLPQNLFREKMKFPLIIEEPIRERAWGEAIQWFIAYSAPQPDGSSIIEMDLIGWSDIGMIKWFNEEEEKKSAPIKIPVTTLITRNITFAKIAKLAMTDKSIPKFQIEQ